MIWQLVVVIAVYKNSIDLADLAELSGKISCPEFNENCRGSS